MASYKHEKENIGYPITSIEIEKDTSEPTEEELEEVEKPIKQTPGYSRIFEFDATLKSFLYKYSQEIEDKIKEFVDSIDWKNLNKDEIINYINKTIEKIGGREEFEKLINKQPSLIESIVKTYLIEKIKQDFPKNIKIDENIKNKSIEEMIDYYISNLKISDSENTEPSEREKYDSIIKLWNEIKEDWPLTKLFNFESKSITIDPVLLKNIKVLEDKTHTLSEAIEAFGILSNLLAPIQLDDVYGYLVDKEILHYIGSDTVVRVGTASVVSGKEPKEYPVVMNKRGMIFVPFSKKLVEKTERGVYVAKKGSRIYLNENIRKDRYVLKEEKDWIILPYDVKVSKVQRFSGRDISLEYKDGKLKKIHIHPFYLVETEDEFFSHRFFYISSEDLTEYKRKVFSNLSEIPWISREFSNSPETPISNSPVEEPGNPYYQSMHNSPADYLAMPNVGDTLGERRIDRGYSGDAEYSNKDYIKLYKEKKKEELKEKLKEHPYCAFFLKRDL